MPDQLTKIGKKNGSFIKEPFSISIYLIAINLFHEIIGRCWQSLSLSKLSIRLFNIPGEFIPRISLSFSFILLDQLVFLAPGMILNGS